MITAVDECKRSRCLARHHVAIATHNHEIAVKKNSSAGMRGVERLLSVEIDGAVEIDAVACQRIVGALHMTTVEQYPSRPVERIHVQTADKAHVARHHAVAVTIGDMRLRDGGAALLPPEPAATDSRGLRCRSCPW